MSIRVKRQVAFCVAVLVAAGLSAYLYQRYLSATDTQAALQQWNAITMMGFMDNQDNVNRDEFSNQSQLYIKLNPMTEKVGWVPVESIDCTEMTGSCPVKWLRTREGFYSQSEIDLCRTAPQIQAVCELISQPGEARSFRSSLGGRPMVETRAWTNKHGFVLFAAPLERITEQSFQRQPVCTEADVGFSCGTNALDESDVVTSVADELGVGIISHIWRDILLVILMVGLFWFLIDNALCSEEKRRRVARAMADGTGGK